MTLSEEAVNAARSAIPEDQTLAPRTLRAALEAAAPFIAAEALADVAMDVPDTKTEWGVRRDADSALHSREAAERTIELQRRRKLRTVLIRRQVGPWQLANEDTQPALADSSAPEKVGPSSAMAERGRRGGESSHRVVGLGDGGRGRPDTQ